MECFSCDSEKIYYVSSYRPNLGKQYSKFTYNCKECDAHRGFLHNEHFAKNNPKSMKEEERIQNIYNEKYKNDENLSYEVILWEKAKEEMTDREDTVNYKNMWNHFERIGISKI